jgi:hypothetical protein
MWNLAAAVDELAENVEGAAAKRHRGTVLFEQPRSGMQGEGAEAPCWRASAYGAFRRIALGVICRKDLLQIVVS